MEGVPIMYAFIGF